MELVHDGLLLQGLGQCCHVVRAGVAVLAREVEQHRADALRLRCTSHTPHVPSDNDRVSAAALFPGFLQTPKTRLLRVQ